MHILGSLASFAETYFIQTYSEELILLQTNHSHLYSAVDSNKAESKNLHPSPGNVLEVFLKKEQRFTFSFSHSSSNFTLISMGKKTEEEDKQSAVISRI